MEQISFKVDNEAKTVTPVLPEIEISVSTPDEGSISYIPKDPDISLKEVLSICKEDVAREASSSSQLYETAESNLKAVIEALTKPVLSDKGYSIVWEDDTANEGGEEAADNEAA